MSGRVVHLAAGAGRMYCGACMRDNRLTARLMQQGHNVALLPLYMPIRTDESDVSRSGVYYGGLSVGLQQKLAFFRHVHRRLDRLLDSPVLLRTLGRVMSRIRPVGIGPLTVSILAGEEGVQRKELHKLVAGLRALEPSLVSLPNLMFVGVAKALKAALGVPILCTLAGEDAFIEALPDPYRDRAFELIRERSTDVDGFIAPTRYYATRAAECFGLDQDRVHYVPMGIRVDDVGCPADPPAEPFTIGYLAGICPEKGLAVLGKAFKLLGKGSRRCRLRIAGYAGAVGRKYWAKIRCGLRQDGLLSAVDYVGEVSRPEKLSFLRSLHVLSVPTIHPEPKGLYVLEAMAGGVPVVQPRHGSFPELVEATGGGRLYDSPDPQALAEAIKELMDNETLRRRLAESGRAAVRDKFSDDIMAAKTWELYERFGVEAGAHSAQ